MPSVKSLLAAFAIATTVHSKLIVPGNPAGGSNVELTCPVAQQNCGGTCIRISGRCCPDLKTWCPQTAECVELSAGGYGCCALLPPGGACTESAVIATSSVSPASSTPIASPAIESPPAESSPIESLPIAVPSVSSTPSDSATPYATPLESSSTASSPSVSPATLPSPYHSLGSATASPVSTIPATAANGTAVHSSSTTSVFPLFTGAANAIAALDLWPIAAGIVGYLVV